jgi:beta-keto acid cleavage enzyme
LQHPLQFRFQGQKGYGLSALLSPNRVEGMSTEMACNWPARSAKAIPGAEMPLRADVLSSVATSMRPPCRMPLPYTAGDSAAQAIAAAEAGASILHLHARRWGWPPRGPA